MPEIFILEGDAEGKTYRVVFHFPVPDTKNKANQSNRTLLAAHEETTSTISELPAAIQTKLSNGEVFEYSFSYNRNPILSDTANELKEMYKEMKPKILTALQNKYKFYGKTLTVEV